MTVRVDLEGEAVEWLIERAVRHRVVCGRIEDRMV